MGLALCLLIAACAVIGPYVAPYSPTDYIDLSFAPPSSHAWLGTDYLGRDVFSRFLAGGQNLLVLAVLATALNIVTGTIVALVAGYSLRFADEALMRSMDLLLAFPPIVLALMCVSVVGPAQWLIVLVVGLSQMPQSARLLRAAVVQVRDLEFVKYAEAVGLPRGRILRQELLPNIMAPLMVEIGLRLTFSIGLIASLDYLGLGVQPPNPDWGLIIQENQSGLDGHVLARARARGRDRAAHDRHQPRHRRHRPLRRRDRPEARGVSDPIVRVEDLRVVVPGSHAIVDGVEFAIRPGEVLGLVGESGSGKTAVAHALLGYARKGMELRGSVRVGGVDMVTASEHERLAVRGQVVSYVPQDPSASLNPALRIRTQLRERLRAHRQSGRDAKIGEVLELMHLPTSREFLRRYPHQLSGGQIQRVCIALAVLCRPKVIVLDEPTTGLDVMTQARVLELVRELIAAEGTAAIYVTHDLAVVAGLADRLAVMYSGLFLEEGPTRTLLDGAAHPYTRRLILSTPSVEARTSLVGIAGTPLNPKDRKEACPFAPRCDYNLPVCVERMPTFDTVATDHRVRCARVGDLGLNGTELRRAARTLWRSRPTRSLLR